MAKSQLAFDIASQTPTTFSVDHKGALSWAEQIDTREGDALARDDAKMTRAEFQKLKAVQTAYSTITAARDVVNNFRF